MSGQSGWSVERKKGTHEDRGGGEVVGNRQPEEAPGSFDCAVPGTFTFGQAGGVGARSSSSSWEEVAGSGAGEMLEEGGEGAHSCLSTRLECISDGLWQAQLRPKMLESRHTTYNSYVHTHN